MTKEGKFSKEYAPELMRIAWQDLSSAQFLSGQEKLRVENVFLLAQQALEKALKSVLCWHRQPIPFLHEIGVLVSKIEALGLRPPFAYSLNGLSEFATIRRYLEGKENWTEAEIVGVLAEVRAACEWCQQQIQA